MDTCLRLDLLVSLQLKTPAVMTPWRAAGRSGVARTMAPTREMSLETKERIVKLLEEGNSSRMVAKDVGCSQSAVSKIWTKYKQHGMVVKAKRTGRPRKTSKRQDKELKAICLENRKSTTKQMKHKWEEAGANVCDRTVRNRLKEMGFQYRKAKRKPSLTPKQKRTRLQWAKERQSWTVDDWMKVIFSDESRICIGQGDDAETFVWCRSSEIYEEDCLKKATKFPQSLMIWGCMSGKGTGEMTVVNSSINAQVYIDILDSFLIPSIEQMFGDDEIIFQDDNASCHRAKTVKAFLGERHIQSMSWPANSPDLNPIEKNGPTCKADLATAIKESWHQIDEEYCLSLKSMPQRLQAVIKAKGGATKY
uniref:Transposase Tc1-like domain-containing protein n=1 Tax=Pygocentrus nattereri TaxID=42514 RepID=A0AAR2K6C9_PYGNA